MPVFILICVVRMCVFMLLFNRRERAEQMLIRLLMFQYHVASDTFVSLDDMEHSVLDAVSDLACHVFDTDFIYRTKNQCLCFFSSMFTVSPISSDVVSEFMVKEQVREMNKEIAEKTEKYKKCKQMLAVSK